MRMTRSEVAKIRLAAGFETAQSAADKLECSVIHLLNFEQGRSNVSRGLLDRMAQLYQRDPELLAGAFAFMRKDLLKRQLEAVNTQLRKPA